jgi:hypothetical protein
MIDFLVSVGLFVIVDVSLAQIHTTLMSRREKSHILGDESFSAAPAQGYDCILLNGFRFPFGDNFVLAIDSDGATQAVWGGGQGV